MTMGEICSCKDVDLWTGHDDACKLWADMGFMRGTSAWDPIKMRLVTFLEWMEDNPGPWSRLLDEWPALSTLHQWGEERKVDLKVQNTVTDDDQAERLVVDEMFEHLGVNPDDLMEGAHWEGDQLVLDDDPVPDDEPEEPFINCTKCNGLHGRFYQCDSDAAEADSKTILGKELAEELADLAKLAEEQEAAKDDKDDDTIVIKPTRVQYTCPYCKGYNMLCEDCGLHCTLCDCPDEARLYCKTCSKIATRGKVEPKPESKTTVTVSTKHKCYCIGECLKKDLHDPKDPKCDCKPECKLWCPKSKVERSDSKDPWHWAEPYCNCTPPKTDKSYYCWTCGIERKKQGDPWQWDQNPPGSSGGAYGFVGGGGGAGFSKCRHYEFPLVYPNGVTVYASSQTTRKEEDPAPDFAVYAASSWNPACLAYMIAWPDMGIPTYKKAAVAAIKEGYERAKSGQKVEFGCIGGHGRTGTMLACMAVLAGVKGEDAVKWVQTNYCSHAVESERQEWFVLWFEADMLGIEPPPMPEPKSYSYNSGPKKNTGDCPGCTHPLKNDVYCHGKGCKCKCDEAFEEWGKAKKQWEKTPVSFNHMEVVCKECNHLKPKDKGYCTGEKTPEGKICNCVCNKMLAENYNAPENAKRLPEWREKFIADQAVAAAKNKPKAESKSKSKSKDKTPKSTTQGSVGGTATKTTPLPVVVPPTFPGTEVGGGSGACPKADAPTETTKQEQFRVSSETNSYRCFLGGDGPDAYCLHPECDKVLPWAQIKCDGCHTEYNIKFWDNRLEEHRERCKPVFPERQLGEVVGDRVWTEFGWKVVRSLEQPQRGQKGERK